MSHQGFSINGASPEALSYRDAANGVSVASVALFHVAPLQTHYDWLFEPPPPPGVSKPNEGERRLIAFRAPKAPWLWGDGQVFYLQRLPDHRRDYLQWTEGWLTGGRGWVERVDQGRCLLHAFDAAHITLTLQLAGARHALALWRTDDPLYWSAQSIPRDEI